MRNLAYLEPDLRWTLCYFIGLTLIGTDLALKGLCAFLCQEPDTHYVPPKPKGRSGGPFFKLAVDKLQERFVFFVDEIVTTLCDVMKANAFRLSWFELPWTSVQCHLYRSLCIL